MHGRCTEAAVLGSAGSERSFNVMDRQPSLGAVKQDVKINS